MDSRRSGGTRNHSIVVTGAGESGDAGQRREPVHDVVRYRAQVGRDDVDQQVTAGLTPAQVLAATTSSSAELLGYGDELGRLAPGYRADLVLVSGDAYDFDQPPGAIREVWRDGVRLVASTVD